MATRWRILLVLLILPVGAYSARLCLDAPAPALTALEKAAATPPADKPQAMPVVHTEGTLPHTGIHDQSNAAMRDPGYMLDLALMWRQTGDKASLARLATYLAAWTKIYHPSFNPIDETRFDSLIAAYSLSKSALPLSTVEQTADFLRALGQGYLDRIERHRSDAHGVWRNNWQSHRIKLATLAAAALRDDAMFARARAAFIAQLSVNMRPDGEVLDFSERDALHYVVYDLEPLVLAALAAQSRGEDWLHLPGKEGQTLAAGLDWLLPYAEGRRTHQEFVNTPIRFDKERAAAGVKGFSGLWNRFTAKSLFWSASVLDARYAAVARSLGATPPRWLWAYAGPCGQTD